MLHLKSPSRFLAACFAVAGLFLMSSRAMRADDLTYTFSGVASGTIVGPTALSSSTFSNQNFSIRFTEDPAIVTGSGGYYLLSSVSGMFTEAALRRR